MRLRLFLLGFSRQLFSCLLRPPSPPQHTNVTISIKCEEEGRKKKERRSLQKITNFEKINIRPARKYTIRNSFLFIYLFTFFLFRLIFLFFFFHFFDAFVSDKKLNFDEKAKKKKRFAFLFRGISALFQKKKSRSEKVYNLSHRQRKTRKKNMFFAGVCKKKTLAQEMHQKSDISERRSKG